MTRLGRDGGRGRGGWSAGAGATGERAVTDVLP